MAVQQGVNDLYTWCLNNGERGQQLIDEWTGIDEDGIQRDIHKVGAKSVIKILWKCKKCQHEWYYKIYNRVAFGSGCHMCTKQKLSKIMRARDLKIGYNDLYTWCLNNGERGQQLLDEWTGIDEQGNHIEINKITYGSGTKMKWKCKNNHEWYSTVNHKTIGRGCPHCSKSSTSYPEQFIYWTLKQIYPNTENRCRVLKSPENPNGIEFDIGVPDIPLCIEYSGAIWHEGKEEYDNFKKMLCEQRGIRFIQIIADKCTEFEDIMTPNYIHINIALSKQDEILTEIMDYILKSIGHSIAEIDLEKVKENAWKYSHGEIEYEKSLAYTHPELVKEWHPTLNKIKPTEITHGSHKKVYWQCTKCGYGKDGEWQATPNRRTYRGKETGCSCCGYNWSDGKIHKTCNHVVITKVNDVYTKYPELIKEWHPTLNKIKPTEITHGSHKKVYWQCTKCGYGKDGEWQATPVRRVAKNYQTGCPQCGYNWFKAQTGQPQKFKGIYRY